MREWMEFGLVKFFLIVKGELIFIYIFHLFFAFVEVIRIFDFFFFA